MKMYFLLAADLNSSLDQFSDKFKELIGTFIPFIIGIIASLMVLWGIYIGIKFASAKKAEQRTEAKEYLKQFLIGIILIFVIGVLGGLLITGLSGWAGIQ